MNCFTLLVYGCDLSLSSLSHNVHNRPTLILFQIGLNREQFHGAQKLSIETITIVYFEREVKEKVLKLVRCLSHIFAISTKNVILVWVGKSHHLFAKGKILRRLTEIQICLSQHYGKTAWIIIRCILRA